MAAALAACGEHPATRRPCRCWRVTPCPQFRGITHVPAGSYRSKPARDGGLREKDLVHDSAGYLQAMQSVGGSRWAVTVPEPCPHFHAHTYVDQRLVAASRCVTRRRIRLFLPAQLPPFSSSGGGRYAAAFVHRPDSPGGCAHAALAPSVAGDVADRQSSKSFGRWWLFRRAGTNDGRPYIAAGGSLIWTFVLYRTMRDSNSLSTQAAR